MNAPYMQVQPWDVTVDQLVTTQMVDLGSIDLIYQYLPTYQYFWLQRVIY